MTVEAGTQAYVQYTGTGTRVFFEYDFIMLADSVVYVLVDGQPTEVTLQDTGVVFDVAPAVGAVILIYRITDITQLADFQQFEAFHGVKTEDALDKLILLKQEAAIFRAQMNLFANHMLDRVTIENDKGTDADIFYWNELEAGVFGGEVTQNMPNAGAVVEKPEDFAYFQYGFLEILTQTVTTTLYPIEATEEALMGATIVSGYMQDIMTDTMGWGGDFVGAVRTPVKLSYGPDTDAMGWGGDFISAVRTDFKLSYGPDEDSMGWGGDFISAVRGPGKVDAFAPAEEVQMNTTLDLTYCYMQDET